MTLAQYHIKNFVVGPLESNCWVVYDTSQKAVIIDPGFHDRGINNFLRKNNLNLEYVLNTHGHADHIIANSQFSAPILIHELDAPFLSDGEKNLSAFSGIPANFSFGKPSRLLKNGDEIKAGALLFKVIHTPGHTPGSICLLMGKELFTGDTLFMEGVGRTDFTYSDEQALADSLREKIFVLDDDVNVYPGHGPSTTIGHERAHNPFV